MILGETILNTYQFGHLIVVLHMENKIEFSNFYNEEVEPVEQVLHV